MPPPGDKPIFETNGRYNVQYIKDYQSWASGTYKPSDVNRVVNEFKTRAMGSTFNSGTQTGSGASSLLGGIGSTINMITNTASGMITAGIYDRLGNTSYRLSSDIAANTMKGIAEAFTRFDITGIIGVLGNEITRAISSQTELNDKLIERVKIYGSQVGNLGKEMVRELNDSLISVTKIGMSADDFMETVKNMMSASGRMTTTNEQFLTNAVKASTAYTTSSRTLTDNSEKFRNVGLGLGDVATSIENIGKRSIALGLNARQTNEKIVEQIEKLNSFGFKGGIEGLSKMVQESQALNYNVENTFSVAEQLFDPSKAIDMTARLQVLGGAFGDFSNPLKIMYDAVDNVNGLQTSIIGAARSLATYNQEQGRFEVTGANLRRAKEMADALGIKMTELTNTAVKAATKAQALSEINMFPGLNDDQKEFLSNLTQIQKGEVGFVLPKSVQEDLKLDKSKVDNGFVKMSDLNSNQLTQLKQIQENMAQQKTDDILRDQFNAITNIKNQLTAITLMMSRDVQYSTKGQDLTKTLYDEARKLKEQGESAKDTLDILSKLTGKSVEEVKQRMKASPLGGGLLDYIDPDNAKAIANQIQGKTVQQNQQTQAATATPPTQNIHVEGDIYLKSQNILDPVRREYLKNPGLRDAINGKISPKLEKGAYVK